MAVIDVTTDTFETEVIQRSHEVPVVVDFWAAWCGPCRTLGPLLERLADEAGGDWILAKVDVDANQALAARYGVQGIPAVHAFRGGREVDRFVGALPEAQVRTVLAGLGPSTAELLLEEARGAEAVGDTDAALERYRAALREAPANLDAKAGIARLELAARAARADEDALRARLDADPSDIEALTGLADARLAAGDAAAAFAVLTDAIRDGRCDREAARTHLLALLDTLPPDDPRALKARRDLAAALY